MKVKVILIRSVPKLGKIGDIVSVSSGFFINCLFPRKEAMFLGKNSSLAIDQLLKKEIEKEHSEKEVVNDIKTQISNASIEINTKATDDGKIFGSITLEDIKNKINDQISNLGFDYKLESRNISLQGEVHKIKTIGDYVTRVTFFDDLFCDVSLKIKRI